MSKKIQPKPVGGRGAATATSPASPVKTATRGSGASVIKILSIILVAVTFVLYFNTLQNGYVLDDVIMVKENTIVAKGLKGIPELLSTPHMRGYLVIPNDTYRPLSLVMFAIEYQLAGTNPAVNHFFNIVTFALCVLLFFIFLHRFFDEKKVVVAFAGALLFAIHPVHTEVVANIKSRDEILCFLFAFWSLNVFMSYMKEGKITQWAAGTFLLFLSIISKENTITFLGVVPLFFFLYKNSDRKRAIMTTAGAVLSAVLFIIIRAVVLKAYNANESSDIEFIDNALVRAPDFVTRLATAVLICGKYLKLLFIPAPLLCNYSYRSIPFSTFGDTGVLASLAAYGAMIYFAVTRLIKNRKDPWAFAILFYLMTISLFTNLFILIGAEMGERFLFMASAGLCMAAAFAVDKWLIKEGADSIASLKSPKILAVLVPLTLIFGGMTIARNKDWTDSVTLYRADLEKSPEDCRLNYYLGTALAENLYNEEPDAAKRKEIDMEALTHLRASLAIYPDFSEANAEMGRIFDREQRYDSAEYYDQRALVLNPGHAVATNNLGSVYLASGKYEKAIETFRKALVINPDFQLAYFNMARTFNQLKQYDSAIANYKKMLEYRPDYLDAFQEMGMSYFSKGDYVRAEENFKKVLTINPDESSAMNNLGAIYLNQKNYAKAIEQFLASIKVNPNYINAYSNIGRAYYFNKQYAQAIESFNKQLSMNDKAFENIPYIALSYQGLGNMAEAKKYEAIAKTYYSDFRLN